MEFENLQKIWIDTSSQPFYGFSEQTLSGRIDGKKKSSSKIANISEFMTITVNLAAGLWILISNLNGKQNTWLYLMGAWMLATAVFGGLHRYRRLQMQPKTSGTMRDHLSQGVYTATAQVRLSFILRLAIIPLALLTTLGLWSVGSPVWIVICAALFFAASFYFSGWEHRVYVRKKNELVSLRELLDR